MIKQDSFSVLLIDILFLFDCYIDIFLFVLILNSAKSIVKKNRYTSVNTTPYACIYTIAFL